MEHLAISRYPAGRCLAIVVAVLLPLAGCRGPEPAPSPRPTRPVATLFPTNSSAASTLAATPSPDSGWLAGSAGVAVRRLHVPGAPDQPPFPVIVVRLDPARVQLRVAYDPERPLPIRDWFAEAQPLLAINGGFFTAEYRSTALVISDGVASGTSYQGFGGMLAVAPDGQISLRALRDQPYDPREPVDQALQSFPMLIFPGGILAAIEEDGQRARRTAVAMDRAGRLLFVVSPTSGFTLRGFAEWLHQSDLEIDRALNLDGGASTGLYLKAGALHEQIDSLERLPLVILVE
jgi:uncharacterized protein YigE (DUF2233 family)